MFHCHNLVHEDHDMMAAFNVSDVDLTAYGYGDEVLPLLRINLLNFSKLTFFN